MAAYEALGARLHAQAHAHEAPDVSAAVALEMDSAAAIVVVYGPDQRVIEEYAERLGGAPFDRDDLPAEYIAGLAARRARAVAATESGGWIRVDQRRPGTLDADGTIRPF